MNAHTGLDRYSWASGGWGFQEFKTVHTQRWQGFQPYAMAISLVLIYVRGWIGPHSHSVAGRTKSMKNFKDPVGNRTGDLPVVAQCLNNVVYPYSLTSYSYCNCLNTDSSMNWQVYTTHRLMLSGIYRNKLII